MTYVSIGSWLDDRWEGFVESWSWTAAGVVVALVLGVLSLALQWVQHRRSTKRDREELAVADLEFRYERYWGHGEQLFRLVVINHGPATAKELKLRAKRPKQGNWTINAEFGRLLPRQEFHWPISWDQGGQDDWLFGELSWVDGRKGRQEDSAPRLMSRQDIPGG